MAAAVPHPMICVLVPTFNNVGTLPAVLRGIKAACDLPVIVVNDGSTDGTAQLLDAQEGIHVLHLRANKGKGHALRQGFAMARTLGCTHAITIDSDGQHDPADLPAMMDAIKQDPAAMVMGARDMDKREVPGRSSFGNRFSNFWFKVETGITLPDTQTGYRGWPLEPLHSIRTISDRFGFEVESIVKLAWRGTPFRVVPVTVRYDYPERVSHFRPFTDFALISLLNTWLVTAALLWYWPRQLFLRGGLWRAIRSEAVRPDESSLRKACAIGFGFFMGIVPIWGLQLAVGIPLAYALRLNRLLFVASANISLPPMIPFILYASYRMGAPFAGARAFIPEDISGLTIAGIHEHVMQYATGAVVLAICAGTVATAIAYPVITLLRRRVVA